MPTRRSLEDQIQHLQRELVALDILPAEPEIEPNDCVVLALTRTWSVGRTYHYALVGYRRRVSPPGRAMGLHYEQVWTATGSNNLRDVTWAEVCDWLAAKGGEWRMWQATELVEIGNSDAYNEARKQDIR